VQGVRDLGRGEPVRLAVERLVAAGVREVVLRAEAPQPDREPEVREALGDCRAEAP